MVNRESLRVDYYFLSSFSSAAAACSSFSGVE